MKRITTLLIAAFVLCSVVAHYATEASAQSVQYTVSDLGTLGGPTSEADAISQNGIIVGSAETPTRADPPFIYQGNGPMQDLGLLDPVNGRAGQANSVNCEGQVVGLSDAAGTTVTHAFYYAGAGPLTDLGTLGGQNSFAYGINESGQIAGYAQTTSGAYHGVLWTVGGPTLDLGAGFFGLAINDQGQIGGFAVQTQHAALYNLSSGSITDLGTLGGVESQVEGMNNNGLVVGLADTPTSSHGFLYNTNTGVLTDLGTLGSPSWTSIAFSVNDLGQVVGGSAISSDVLNTAAFIYTQAGGMQNLNDLIDPSSGWDLWTATGINNSGLIVGSGLNPQGTMDAFLLTPVPEPSTLQLIIAILGIFTGRLAWAYRRAK